MRVLIVSQYFAPEVTAASLRLEPIARGLAELGHDVEVVCEVPSHPQGVVARGYGGRAVDRRSADGYRVSHVWVHASPSKRARTRLASYASYAAMAAAVGGALRAPDVVLASSPPLSVGAVGDLLARRFRVPLVLDVRDLWPQAPLALGEISPGRVSRAAERLERYLYRRAAAVTTPTPSFREHIVAHGARPESVYVLANGTTRAWLEAGELPPDREGAGLPPEGECFVWTYAGNVGLSQNLETAIDAAALLGAGFQLLILGDGTSKSRLEKNARTVGGGGVLFRDSVPPERAMEIMRASDALLVPLADVPELGRSVPVKLYDYCAIGRPVIAGVPGATRQLIEQEEIALLAPPGDAVALAECVRNLAERPEQAGPLIDSARRFARANLREDGVRKLTGILAGAAQFRG